MNAQEWKAGSVVSEEDMADASLSRYFCVEEIGNEVFERMKGKSFSNSCTTPRENLRYLRVLHYNKEGRLQRGEMVCNKAIAADLLDIFRKLYEAKYCIERMVLVDDYDAKDEASMTANNSSCFNFRFINGTKLISKHGQGMAVDINPLYNPCYNTKNGFCEPAAGKPYAKNRKNKKKNPMLINKSDLCYKLFVQHGFKWGGDWLVKKDYQHFEK